MELCCVNLMCLDMRNECTNRFFKGTSGQSSSLLSVDTVTSDGHQVTFGSHDITQQGQVSIVDVGTIKRDDMVHLFLNTFSHSLDT